MRATKMGLLCRSQAATAVCSPGDGRAAVVPSTRPPDHAISENGLLLEANKNTRLANHRHRLPTERNRRRHQVVTLSMVTKREDKPKTKPEARPTHPNENEIFQVVVMRVSIHCQGCAGKVRKLISKMEGVTSYSIDLDSKRVTVMGHVSPSGVLESISKVKKAEFWPC
ncbi:hypothetical protein HPP92_002075 [Vanilla planifolia]|uniref:HMA domain-containing protein n=1 Tax=Vanilla planifolia TaxID=51239 RepID=A0A835S3Q0_VANPL|nr:hypothetical protein HPP92_002075 [Vanilla planifolia]